MTSIIARSLSTQVGRYFLPLTLIRISFGLFFFASGLNKLIQPDNQQAMLHTMIEAGLPYPAFMATFVAGNEALFGFLLVLGLLSRLSALVLLVINIVALMTIGIHQIPADVTGLEWYSWLLYLPESVYILLCILIAVQGSGPLGLDLRLGRLLPTTGRWPQATGYHPYK
ncbi:MULTISPECIES: DoxX family protein [Aeromonas]|uniref:DoxX family protein n=1 Tax=Aeromonas TaxID=642 RepID=UPI00111BA778|nr:MULTISPECIES: DoxX family membrane protein [Aeromonas]MBS4700868.1 DoxX family protein [Aeromonas media]NEX80424.1 DoxX family protein [Aeromonas rivipollensis]QIY87135.1 DoxX family protein [Aeromonas hydrophila]TNI75214.1 DoxX family protein [Aeromonas media]